MVEFFFFLIKMVELSIKTYKIECSYIWYMINLREHLTEFTYVTFIKKKKKKRIYLCNTS